MFITKLAESKFCSVTDPSSYENGEGVFLNANDRNLIGCIGCLSHSAIRSRPHAPAPDELKHDIEFKQACIENLMLHINILNARMAEMMQEAARAATLAVTPAIQELRNALIVAANNAHERKAIVNEVKPERTFYNEMQFRSLVENALELSMNFKSEYESKVPLEWNRESLRQSTTAGDEQR